MATIHDLKTVARNGGACDESLRWLGRFNPEDDVKVAFDALEYTERWWLSDISSIIGETDEDDTEAYEAVNQFSIRVSNEYDRTPFFNADGSTMSVVERYALWKPIREQMWVEFKQQYWQQFSARWIAQIERFK